MRKIKIMAVVAARMLIPGFSGAVTEETLGAALSFCVCLVLSHSKNLYTVLSIPISHGINSLSNIL